MKKLIFLACFLSLFLTGCSGKDEVSSAVGTVSIIVGSSNIESSVDISSEDVTTVPEDSLPEEDITTKPDFVEIPEQYEEGADVPVYIPDITLYGEKNYEPMLSDITVDGKTVDINVEPIESVVSKLGLTRREGLFYQDGIEDINSITFYGTGYGVHTGLADVEKQWTKSFLFIECMDDTGIETWANEQYAGMKIRAVYTNAECTGETHIAFCGVECGMSEDKVIALLGEGNTTRNMTYYANDENQLFIKYENGVVNEMYLVNDTGSVKTEFCPEEYGIVIDDDSSDMVSEEAIAVPVE